MRFAEAPIVGAWLIDLEPVVDERGFFARTFCADEFAERGIDATVAQCNMSLTRAAGTIRGLHYQVAPAAETKLVRVVRGAVHDVIVDVRADSKTYLRHFAVELSEDNRRSLFVPVGLRARPPNPRGRDVCGVPDGRQVHARDGPRRALRRSAAGDRVAEADHGSFGERPGLAAHRGPDRSACMSHSLQKNRSSMRCSARGGGPE